MNIVIIQEQLRIHLEARAMYGKTMERADLINVLIWVVNIYPMPACAIWECSIAGKSFKRLYQINQAMTKKVSLNIPDESYKKLASLSDFYKLDVEDAIINLLDVVGIESQTILNLSKEYKIPIKLAGVISHIFFAGFRSLRALFNEILENLEVKGLYTLSDFDVDLDENYMWFHYDALVGRNLQIDSIDVALKPGLKSLSTTSYIEAKKLDSEVLGNLKKLIQSDAVREEFESLELEDYNIEIEEEEESWILTIDCREESLSYLPSVNRMSKFVEQIFKKAGVEKEGIDC